MTGKNIFFGLVCSKHNSHKPRCRRFLPADVLETTWSHNNTTAITNSVLMLLHFSLQFLLLRRSYFLLHLQVAVPSSYIKLQKCFQQGLYKSFPVCVYLRQSSLISWLGTIAAWFALLKTLSLCWLKLKLGLISVSKYLTLIWHLQNLVVDSTRGGISVSLCLYHKLFCFGHIDLQIAGLAPFLQYRDMLPLKWDYFSDKKSPNKAMSSAYLNTLTLLSP